MTLIDTLFAIIWSPFVRFRELLLTPICQKQQKVNLLWSTFLKLIFNVVKLAQLFNGSLHMPAGHNLADSHHLGNLIFLYGRL